MVSFYSQRLNYGNKCLAKFYYIKKQWQNQNLVPHPPAWLASVVVRPYHVAQKLEHLFIKDNNGTNIFTVKFCLHFTQKYCAVGRV